MNSQEFIKAVDLVSKEKGIEKDLIFEAMELALTSAYKKNFDSKTNVRVDINKDTGDIKVYSVLHVVDKIDEETDEELDDENVEKVEENNDAKILLEDAV